MHLPLGFDRSAAEARLPRTGHSVIAALALAPLAAIAFGCRAGKAPPPPAEHAYARPRQTSLVVECRTDARTAAELQEIAYAFTASSGVPVKLATAPPETEGGRAARSARPPDLLIADGPTLRREAAGGRLEDLTAWAHGAVDLTEIAPEALRGLAYAPGAAGRRLVALPVQPDAMGLVCRTDLLNSPAERAAFRREYGYALAPPDTWKRLLDEARFFTRPATGVYGVALPYSSRNNAIVAGFAPLLWSTGSGLLQASAPESGANVRAGIDALRLYAVELRNCAPPGYLATDDAGAAQLFASGKVVFAEVPFTEMSALLDVAGAAGKYSRYTACIAAPSGTEGRRTCVLGYGVGVQIGAPRRTAALRFIRWLEQPELQAQWARAGGLTANGRALRSPLFETYSQYHGAWARAITGLRAFAGDSRTQALMARCAAQWHRVAAGAETPDQAMRAVEQSP